MSGHQKSVNGLKSTFFHGFQERNSRPGLACRGARGQVPGEADHMVAARDDFGIMGGKHESAAVRRDAQQPGQHEFARDGILLGGRLVGDEQFRPRRQGPRHRYALLLAARKFLHQVIPVVAEAELGERGVRGRDGQPGGHAPGPQHDLHVLRRGQQRNQPVTLQHRGGAGGQRARRHQFSAAPHRSRRGSGETGEYGEQAGLARPGRTGSRHPVTWPHGQADALEDNPPAAFEAETLGLQQAHSSSSAPMVPGSTRRSSTPPSARLAVASEPGGNSSSRSGGRVTVPSLPTTMYSRPPWPAAPTRPSLMVIVRPSAAATSGSWVTATTVVPRLALAAWISSITSPADSGSSWLVGSSASSSRGPLASATATASRCCSPPDSSPAVRCAALARPTRSSRSAARRRLTRLLRRVGAWAKSTFPVADWLGSRLLAGFCSRRPTSRSRMLVSARPLNPESGRPPTSTVPAVGLSSPARCHSRVVFPAPDGPSSATISPGSMTRSTPLSAATSLPGVPYTCTRFSQRTAGAAGAVMAAPP